jgi:hypothetical protein
MGRVRKPISSISLQDWLVLSASPEIRENIKNDLYSEAYLSLSKMFPNIQKTSWDGAVLALHIVYGWMPTIPKLRTYQHWDSSDRQRLVNILIQVEQKKSIHQSDLEHLKAFSNNSIIGGSKILHFLWPENYPIWDMRVARAFYNCKKPNAYDVNDVGRFLVYQKTLAGWLTNSQAQNQMPTIRSIAPFLQPVSDLRLVELVLFHK